LVDLPCRWRAYAGPSLWDLARSALGRLCLDLIGGPPVFLRTRARTTPSDDRHLVCSLGGCAVVVWGTLASRFRQLGGLPGGDCTFLTPFLSALSCRRPFSHTMYLPSLAPKCTFWSLLAVWWVMELSGPRPCHSEGGEERG
jgi:hypothetical protein